ncbi:MULTISPECIES: nucleotidyl transferase AbiEii/AbiGii toxin family protein [Gracilibacillus]|uniref:nucleotidyl transferase AbiEii/AbiGii toxin family protein n=1 Tax=Gracilibacillus TaxID=74385 RepID=UPI0008250036|nr:MULTISPECIES: nucleotidyl transferase AbiEii/AbiGii toxin family protein [Gracilibacillus]
MLSQQKMKNLIRQKSKESKLPVQQLYGLYAMDRLILKLSKSSYADHLIVKGGFLLTTDLGICMRATRDLDFTLRDAILSKDTLNELIDVINFTEDNSNEYFKVSSMSETREDFEYNGYNLKIDYYNGSTKIPINIDLTTGEDLIGVTDKKNFKSIFSDEEYILSSYSPEQIIIDKFYTLLAYGELDDTNSRMKDYYDLYMLTKRNDEIDSGKVLSGLNKTMKQRKTFIEIGNYDEIIDYLRESNNQKALWATFVESNPYIESISFAEVMNQIEWFSNKLEHTYQKGIIHKKNNDPERHGF